MATRKQETIVLGLALALVVAVFGRAVGFPFLHWDDPYHVLANPIVAHPFAHGFGALLRTPFLGYPVPVAVLFLALERALFGLHAEAFHVVNLLLHVLCCILVYRLSIMLGVGARLATLSLLLFGLHPLVVEPVCWVTGQKDLLATALLLGGLVVAIRPGRLVAGQLLCAAAMLAKPSAVAAPLLLALLARFLPKPVAIRWRALVPLAVTAVLVVVLGTIGERESGALHARTLGDALADVAGAFALQIEHFIHPVDLLPAYFRMPGDPPGWLLFAAPAAALAVGILVLRIDAPLGHAARFGFLFAAAAYLPAANLLPIRRWVADCYLYLPLAGLAIGTPALTAAYWPRPLRRSGAASAAIGIGLLAFLSFRQGTTWSSSARLWPDVIRRYPGHPTPLALEAGALLFEGRFEQSHRVYIQLADRFPYYEENLAEQADAFVAREQLDRALERLERGVLRGLVACALRYWDVAWALPAAPIKPDLARFAFRLSFPTMKREVRVPDPFEHMAAVLGRQDLHEPARQAATQAARRRSGTP